MKVNWICLDCALNASGVWPKGHLATFHTDICDICKCQKAVCSYDDWDNLNINDQEVDLGGRD